MGWSSPSSQGIINHLQHLDRSMKDSQKVRCIMRRRMEAKFSVQEIKGACKLRAQEKPNKVSTVQHDTNLTLTNWDEGSIRAMCHVKY